jgi:hypothetical protein
VSCPKSKKDGMVGILLLCVVSGFIQKWDIPKGTNYRRKLSGRFSHSTKSKVSAGFVN